MHLTDEQVEDVLQCNAEAEVALHMADCDHCRVRVQEAQALQGRLRKAFASPEMHAPPRLVEAVRVQIAQHSRPRKPFIVLHALRKAWPAMAAAAAIIVSLIVAFYLATPGEAYAAQQELVGIHQQNLSESHGMFYSQDEPAKLAAYFKQELGFIPAMPKLNQGLSMRGCCVAHFRGRAVGSYVVDSPHGPISIIVIREMPQALGMTNHVERNGQDVWIGSFSGNNTAATRRGEFTYFAVGKVPAENLAELLAKLFET